MANAEIIMSPYTVYLAPVGTAFPAPDAVVGAGWNILGGNGTLSQDEEGVSHSQSINKVRSAGSAAPIKASRTEEDLMISVTLLDMRLEHYDTILRAAGVTTVAAGAGTVGTKAVYLWRGVDVPQFALLARGASPYLDALATDRMQYEIPIVIADGNPEVNFTKGVAAKLALSFSALSDLSAGSDAQRFGRLIAVSAAAA
jgi:hypothetical protein